MKWNGFECIYWNVPDSLGWRLLDFFILFVLLREGVERFRVFEGSPVFFLSFVECFFVLSDLIDGALESIWFISKLSWKWSVSSLLEMEWKIFRKSNRIGNFNCGHYSESESVKCVNSFCAMGFFRFWEFVVFSLLGVACCSEFNVSHSEPALGLTLSTLHSTTNDLLFERSRCFRCAIFRGSSSGRFGKSNLSFIESRLGFMWPQILSANMLSFDRCTYSMWV